MALSGPGELKQLGNIKDRQRESNALVMRQPHFYLGRAPASSLFRLTPPW
jgi:hypothetical protein